MSYIALDLEGRQLKKRNIAGRFYLNNGKTGIAELQIITAEKETAYEIFCNRISRYFTQKEKVIKIEIVKISRKGEKVIYVKEYQN